MTEVELKAWNRNPDKTLAAVQSFSHFESHIIKHDTYWELQTSESDKSNCKPLQVRIRHTESNNKTETVVTCKEQQKKDGIEVNTEHEFSLSDHKPMEFILQAAGFTVYSHKEKDTNVYNPGLFNNLYQCTIELSTVKTLGDFAEIEILLPDNASNDLVEEARKHLITLLAHCEIPESDIEQKYYNQLLRESTKNCETL